MERVVLRGQAEKQEPQSRLLGTAALNFLWLLSLFQDKESNVCFFGRTKEPNEVSSPQANEQFILFGEMPSEF